MSSPPDTAAPAPGRGSRLPYPGRSRDPEGRMPLMEHLRELRNRLGLAPPDVRLLITIDTYFGYVMAMLLIFGIAFELPLVLIVLNMAGAVSHAFIRKYRRIMIFLVFVFAGAATPSPDPFSMLLLAVPCVILVECAELFVWWNDRRRARREAALLAAEGLSDISEE